MKVNFAKSVYIVLFMVLASGVFFLIARSQFVLTFQQNDDLLHQMDELRTVVDEKGELSAEGRSSLYCIAYTPSDETSVKLKQNAEKTLTHMKLDTTSINLDVQTIDYAACDVVLLAIDHLGMAGSERELEEYVADGGYVLMMTALEPDAEFLVLYRKLGISSYGYQVGSYGLDLVSNVLIGEDGWEIRDHFIYNSSLLISLDDHAKLLAKTPEGIPILWRTELGKGAIIVHNGTMFEEKLNRGFLTGAISMLQPDSMYPVYNSKVFFIDDFPAPIAKGRNAAIYEQYEKDLPTFYREIWWPNMLEVAKRHNLRYTGVLIETYGDDVNPPFAYPVDASRLNLISYGREIIKSGGELGIHGYNHQPLNRDARIAAQFDYKTWENGQNMVASIEEVLEFTKGSFPNYTVTSYVPPSNVLSAEGREALKKAWPELKVIAALFIEDETNAAYVQEYEIAPDGVIEMPRVTSGYTERPFDRWAEANVMTSVGIYSNFLHPDDAISEDRSYNMTWEQIYKGFKENMARVEKTYPWVRAMTATEAALDMARVMKTDAKWSVTETGIEGELSGQDANMYFILRTERKIGRLTNCTVKRIDEGVFLVNVYDTEFKLEFGG
ncbi:DUF2194 domain-containing protein [Sporosarcina koreensis]|uniref:DUF2194 domain-containing protein n=1 Tax=Sporosarcina koreensis TaxID=334735 RepID=A0ABW0TZ65_9BACL